MTVADLIEREAEIRPTEVPQVQVGGIEEVVADKGYHSGPALQAMKAAGARTYTRFSLRRMHKLGVLRPLRLTDISVG
jgi:hypothetical protein